MNIVQSFCFLEFEIQLRKQFCGLPFFGNTIPRALTLASVNMSHIWQISTNGMAYCSLITESMDTPE